MAEVIATDDRQPEVSLNAGSELDDEEHHVEPSHELLFGKFTPGKVPELREDVELIALEGALQDLAYLKQDMLRTGGMRQSFALEAQRLLPSFDGGVPLGYYTKEPSATRYKVALEEIHKGFWALLAAAVAAVIAAIVKLISWWRGSGKSASDAAASRASVAEDNEQVLKTSEAHLQKLQEALRGDASMMSGGESDRALSMDTLMKDVWDNPARYERVMNFLKLPDPIYRDILTAGPYSQAFYQLSGHLGGITNVLRLKLTELEKVSHLDKHSFLQQDTSINQHVLQIIATPIKLGFNGKSLPLAEVADQLSQLRQDTEQQEDADKPMTLDELTHGVIASYRKSHVSEYFKAQAEIAEVLEHLGDALKRLQKTTGDLSTDGSPGHNSEGVGAHLRDVIFQVGKEIADYHRLFSEMNRYGVYLERLTSQAVGLAREVELQLLALDRRGKITMPEDWKSMATDHYVARIHAIFHSASPST